MTRSRTLLLAAALAAPLAPGCTAAEPAAPGRTGSTDSDARRIVRLEETIAGTEERTATYLSEVEGLHARGADGAIERAATGLRAVRDDLERLRVRANDEKARRDQLDELEREARRLADRAEQLHADVVRESEGRGAPGAGA
jgi:chromosome segregation ATPase